MGCGYFTCSKNALLSLNILYILIAILLIGVSAYAKFISLVNSLAVIGAVIGCGVFLLFLACMGFIGAVKHHQICLFFYMIILFILFLVQFSLAIALLAMPESGQTKLVYAGWHASNKETKKDAMEFGQCCGLNTWTDTGFGCPKNIHCCQENPKQICCLQSNMTGGDNSCSCPTCATKLHSYLNSGCKATGGIALFISITEIIGVWLAGRFRNQKDPTADPNAFL